MPADAAGRAERLATLVAREGPLVGVRAPVHPQYVQRVEPFPARVAAVLALVRVVHEVTLVLRQDVKRFAANFTSLPRRRLVHRLVDYQPTFKLKLLIANITRVRFPYRMHIQVTDQIPRVLPANFANLPVVVSQFPHFFSFLHNFLRLFLY